MKRILVVGNAGAGKSTAGRMLSQRLGLPYVSLDAIRWRPGWQLIPRPERKRRLREIAACPEWVTDGTAPALFQAADTIVFLDLSRWECFQRVMRRALLHGFSSRPGLPPGCPELAALPRLLGRMLKNDIPIVFQHAKRKCDLRFASFFNRLSRSKNAGASLHRQQAVEKLRFSTAC